VEGFPALLVCLTSMDLLITLLVYLVIVAIVWWIVQQLPLPEPFRLVAYVLVGILAIVLLLRLVPHSTL
jgi:hypothetical protein